MTTGQIDIEEWLAAARPRPLRPRCRERSRQEAAPPFGLPSLTRLCDSTRLMFV
jgi:hypothetical protein